MAAVIGADWSADRFGASASYYHNCGLRSRSRPQSQPSDQRSRHAAKDIIAQNNSVVPDSACMHARDCSWCCCFDRQFKSWPTCSSVVKSFVVLCEFLFLGKRPWRRFPPCSLLLLFIKLFLNTTSSFLFLMRFCLFPFCFLPVRLSESLFLSEMNLFDPEESLIMGIPLRARLGPADIFPLCLHYTLSDVKGCLCWTDTFDEIFTVSDSPKSKEATLCSLKTVKQGITLPGCVGSFLKVRWNSHQACI